MLDMLQPKNKKHACVGEYKGTNTKHIHCDNEMKLLDAFHKIYEK